MRKPMPEPTPVSAPFWEALAERRIRIQYSPSSDEYVFYPRTLAPRTLAGDLEWREISGDGTLYTFTVARRPTAPFWADRVPQLLAVVQWDEGPRLTTELVLLFLYLGVIGLYNAIDDRRAAARAAGLLAIVGVVLLPVIRYSVVWWNSLHQGQTIRVFGESSMDPSMLQPLVWMVVGTKLWFIGALLARARADNLRRESGKAWVAALAGGGR